MAFQTLQGKVAIITGASRGIGAGIAYELAARGAHVVITYTSPSSKPKVDALTTSIASLGTGAKTCSIAADLRDPSAPQAIISATKTAFRNAPISILVNNAACELHSPLGSLTPADFAHVYDLNVRAPLLMAQAILPHLPPTAGRIINIGSVGARKGFADLALYCSSKAALEALSRVWATELGPRGVTVNCVNPGPVESDMLGEIDEGLVAGQKADTPAGKRIGRPDDVALVVAWLAAEESRWVTGQAVSVSGGLEMY